MNIKQIRCATIIITYAGKKFLIDPFLADKGFYPAFPGTPNQDKSNPLVSLPVSIDQIIDVDAVIVTHTHLDHFDDAAKNALPKTIKMFVQNEQEAKEIKSASFKNVEVLLEEGTVFEDIKLTKTGGIHGIGETIQKLYKEGNFSSNVCGVVFTHPSEKTLYIAGDTVWCDPVKKAIDNHKPDIIVLNAGDAQFLEGGSIIMGKKDVYEVYNAAPQAKIIASHLEAVNHGLLTRKELKEFIDEKGISSNILIPADGEDYTF